MQQPNSIHISEAIGICPQLGGEIEKGNLPSTWGQNIDLLFSIPWSHHKAIVDKVKGDAQKGLFFVRKSLQNQWGRAMLENMLATDLYETTGKSVNNECIGLLICRSKNNIFAQYALSKINAPIGVAEYDIQHILPTTEELEQYLNIK